jgi:adenylate cyclase
LPLGRRLWKAIISSHLPSDAVQSSPNLTGAVLCMFYFIFLDPPEALPQMDQMLLVSLIMTLGFVVLGTLYGLKWQKEIFNFFRLLRQGQSIPDKLNSRARRKAVNAPVFGAVLSMAIWLMAAIIMSVVRYHTLDLNELEFSAPYNAMRVFVGVMAAGAASSSIVFFAFEAIYRPLLPVMYPQGGLVGAKGVFRLNLITRLLFSYFLVGVGPMLLAGLIYYHKTTTLLHGSPASSRTGVIYAIVFIVLASVGLAVILSRLVSASVVGPVGEMQKATARVKEGNLDDSVRVTSNDELGSLGESFNLMLDGMRERRLLKDTFGKYVSQQVRDEILAGRIALDGESKEVTMLFADLRNFTPMVEATPPKTVVRIINAYFQEMTQAIQDQHGLVMQFIGDEIEAVFGAPLPVKDHAQHAVNAALEMRARLEKLNRKLEEQGQKPLRHGIGIHCGTVLAGNIGSADRLSYALVGDTVNLASRIQGLNKKFGTDILISDAAKQALIQAPELKEMPPVEVKGKSRPVQVYAVV